MGWRCSGGRQASQPPDADIGAWCRPAHWPTAVHAQRARRPRSANAYAPSVGRLFEDDIEEIRPVRAREPSGVHDVKMVTLELLPQLEPARKEVVSREHCARNRALF